MTFRVIIHRLCPVNDVAYGLGVCLYWAIGTAESRRPSMCEGAPPFEDYWEATSSSEEDHATGRRDSTAHLNRATEIIGDSKSGDRQPRKLLLLSCDGLRRNHIKAVLAVGHCHESLAYRPTPPLG